ncbi:MAG: glucose 1-dehydrogenase [Candidatus Nanopelagicaceae bacterium]|nr:glucose 1-dehydrogenase [Candidatus Nanopelagicaceae bacterium]
MFRLNGKKALVTGAAGGLGKAIADGLSQQGALVYGTSRDQATAEFLATRYGSEPIVLDQADLRGIETAVERLYELSGGIDLLCNNAGINIPQKATEVDVETWNKILNVNLSGVFFLSQAIGKRWIRDGNKGSIVNVSSQAGSVAIEERASYGASKAGLSHLTKVLALEWASHGIRVNAIAPTFIRTELTESTLSEPGWAEELLSRIPLGRFGTPEDVAGAVVYLLSEEASLVTGHLLTVDGGYTIR